MDTVEILGRKVLVDPAIVRVEDHLVVDYCETMAEAIARCEGDPAHRPAYRRVEDQDAPFAWSIW